MNPNSPACQFFLSPNGRDDWSGRLAGPAPDGSDGPFATLREARDAARDQRRQYPRDHVEIILRGGTYTLDETLVLGPEDDAAPDRPLTWRAFEGETPVLSGGAPLANWRRLKDEPAHLHPSARGHVWVADIPESAGCVRTLYADGRRLPRACGEGFARKAVEDIDAKSAKASTTFAFPEGALEAWPDAAQCEVVLIPKNAWTMNILPLASVDGAARIARTASPATYPLLPNNRDENTWVENSLAVLREPGRWVCNADEGKVYLWPETDEPPRAITAGRLTELIRIEGEVHEEAGADHPLEGIVLRGLTFAQGDRYAWHGQTGRGLQHDWDMHDAPTAMLRLRAASNCRIESTPYRPPQPHPRLPEPVDVRGHPLRRRPARHVVPKQPVPSSRRHGHRNHHQGAQRHRGQHRRLPAGGGHPSRHDLS